MQFGYCGLILAVDHLFGRGRIILNLKKKEHEVVLSLLVGDHSLHLVLLNGYSEKHEQTLLFLTRDHALPRASMMEFYRLWTEPITRALIKESRKRTKLVWCNFVASGRRSCTASHASQREVGKARARTREFIASGLKSLYSYFSFPKMGSL